MSRRNQVCSLRSSERMRLAQIKPMTQIIVVQWKPYHPDWLEIHFDHEAFEERFTECFLYSSQINQNSPWAKMTTADWPKFKISKGEMRTTALKWHMLGWLGNSRYISHLPLANYSFQIWSICHEGNFGKSEILALSIKFFGQSDIGRCAKTV